MEPLQPKNLLMGGDLEYAVGRRVADRLTGLQMLLAELRDDVRAGGVTIAEDAGHGGLFQKSVSELPRKARLRLREITPVETNRHAGDFRMTGGRILSPGPLARASTLRAYLATICQSRSLPAGGEAMSFTQSEFDKMGRCSRPSRSSLSASPTAQASAIWPIVSAPYRHTPRHPVRRRCPRSP
jgi:hypothetical protein